MFIYRNFNRIKEKTDNQKIECGVFEAAKNK